MSAACKDCSVELTYSGRGRPPVRCAPCAKARCKAKAADYQRRYYAKNKDKVTDYQRRYYAENKDKGTDYQRRRHAEKMVAKHGPAPDCKDCGKPGASRVSERCDPCHLEWEDEVIALRETGLTNLEIGQTYGVSKQRIQQVVAALAPHLTGSQSARRKALS